MTNGKSLRGCIHLGFTKICFSVVPSFTYIPWKFLLKFRKIDNFIVCNGSLNIIYFFKYIVVNFSLKSHTFAFKWSAFFENSKFSNLSKIKYFFIMYFEKVFLFLIFYEKWRSHDDYRERCLHRTAFQRSHLYGTYFHIYS